MNKLTITNPNEIEGSFLNGDYQVQFFGRALNFEEDNYGFGIHTTISNFEIGKFVIFKEITPNKTVVVRWKFLNGKDGQFHIQLGRLKDKTIVLEYITWLVNNYKNGA